MPCTSTPSCIPTHAHTITPTRQIMHAKTNTCQETENEMIEVKGKKHSLNGVTCGAPTEAPAERGKPRRMSLDRASRREGRGYVRARRR